jgi:hypothetical protein
VKKNIKQEEDAQILHLALYSQGERSGFRRGVKETFVSPGF